VLVDPGISIGLFDHGFQLDDFAFHSVLFLRELTRPIKPIPSLPNRQKYTTMAPGMMHLRVFKLSKQAGMSMTNQDEARNEEKEPSAQQGSNSPRPFNKG